MKRRLAHQAGKGPSVDRSLTAQREKREKKAEEDVLFDWGGGSDDDVDPNASSDDDSDEEPASLQNETAEEKRLRLTKELLAKYEVADDESGDDGEDDDDEDDGLDPHARMQKKLEKEADDARGVGFIEVAEQLRGFTFEEDDIQVRAGHKLSATCVALSRDDTTAYTGSKDCSLVRWDIETGKKTYLARRMFYKPKNRNNGQQRDAHEYNFNKDQLNKVSKEAAEAEDGTTEIYSVAVSCDGKYVASGGKDKLVYIWDSRSGTLIDTLQGHAKPVSALAFRLKTHQLFSGSHDRCLKHWNVDDMGYVESLYGHGTEVNSIDVLHKEKVVSSGHDRSVRLWKLETDSQLVFNGHKNSIDCVRYMSDSSFISGSTDGSLALWSAAKKKPLCMVYNAHPCPLASSADVESPSSWICSLTSMRRTDLAISGSCDGYIRFWLTKLFPRTFEEVCTMPLKGFANGMSVATSGRFLVAAVGQEHRLGRWSRVKGAKNGLCIAQLPVKI